MISPLQISTDTKKKKKRATAVVIVENGGGFALVWNGEIRVIWGDKK